MRSLSVVLPVMLAALAFPHSALPQGESDRRCRAPAPPYGERAYWYDQDDQVVFDTSARAPTSIATRFAGEYRLLVVTTEGRLEKEISEYRMVLTPPTRTEREKIGRLPAVVSGRLQVPLIARLTYQRGSRGNKMTSDQPFPDLSGEENFEYWPATGKIGFSVGLGGDTGTLFQVTDVAAVGPFTGRWQGGGYVSIEVVTPIQPVLEVDRGYFCALPATG